MAWRREGWLTPVVISAIVVAALALSYASYDYASQVARRGEASLVETTRDIAQEKVQRIENLIVDSDIAVFRLVDVDNLKDLYRRWSDIGRAYPLVYSIIVVTAPGKIAPDGYISKKPKAEADAFRALFEGRIVKDLGLDKLKPKDIKHFHREYGGLSYLLAVTRADSNSFVVLEIDMVYLVQQVFIPEFTPDTHRRLYQIVDGEGRFKFGKPFTGASDKYVVSLPFSDTLSDWRLQMMRTDAPRLAAEERGRRLSGWIFIGVSALTLFVGLGVLLFAMRTEKRANTLKSDFIANVSHELKTPLSLIRMFGELLASGRTKGVESAREYAQIITRESERLSHLIDNVLDFARLERGKVAYDMKVGDLADVLARGLDVYRYRLVQEAVKLEVDIEPDLPPVRFDENAMTLVLLNLVDNAVKYAPDGKVLQVSLLRRGESVLLQVVDSGTGIADDERGRIFERFYRSRNVRGRTVRGSGIGLALVKHIAEAHGGSVEVESVVGKGSTFTVSLPTYQEPQPEGNDASA
jgi:two-component system, OmpR family, phosphate regulon sensor histidine kinase PhoR